VILLAEHDEPSLAPTKKRQPGASSRPTSTPKNRVWGFESIPSGRPGADLDLSCENATGSVQFTYQNASGRAGWLSRDPLGEGSDATLYSYVGNNPAVYIDADGLRQEDPGPPVPNTGPAGPPGFLDEGGGLDQFLQSAGLRGGVGAAQAGSGFKNMYTGAEMCSTGEGAVFGIPTMLYGLYGLFKGACNMQHAAAPQGGGFNFGHPSAAPTTPAPSPPAPPPPAPPSGGPNDPNDPMYHPTMGPF